MRLKRLELHQFRCFDDETIEFAPSTVLIGPNNSGKSTICTFCQRAGKKMPISRLCAECRFGDS